MLATDVLCAWTRHTKGGATTRYAGLTALHLYEEARKPGCCYRLGDEKVCQINKAILNSDNEILPELTVIFEKIITEKQTDHRSFYTPLCEHLLENFFQCGCMCTKAPELVLQLAKCFWLKSNVQKN